MGRHSQKVANAALESGMDVPDSCLPPEVHSDLESYLLPPGEHFWTLSSSRSLGFGVIGPIPWDVIDRYAHRNGFAEDDVDYDDFIYIIKTLDGVFMEMSRPKSEAGKGGASGKGA